MLRSKIAAERGVISTRRTFIKTRMVNCLIVGIGAFAGSALIQYFGSTEAVNFTKASITGFTFFAVMSIYTLVSMRKSSK
jgi:hypothetical protein